MAIKLRALQTFPSKPTIKKIEGILINEFMLGNEWTLTDDVKIAYEGVEFKLEIHLKINDRIKSIRSLQYSGSLTGDLPYDIKSHNAWVGKIKRVLQKLNSVAPNGALLYSPKPRK